MAALAAACATLGVADPERAVAQEPIDRIPPHKDPMTYLADAETVEDLRVMCRRLMLTATDILERHEKGPGVETYRDALRAIKALHLIRSNDSRALKALCRTINIHDKTAGMRPLSGYIAAEALVEIGGREAAHAIFASMRVPLDKEGTLLRVFVLRGIDSVEITMERIRLEIAAVEKTSLDDDALRDNYLENLRQVQKWLPNPKLGAFENWPLRHKVPGAGPRDLD